MKKTLLYILSAFLIFSACRKDKINTEKTSITIGTSTVESALSGQVVDEEGKAIRGATVTLENMQQITNNDGYFRFAKVDLLEDGAFLTVENSSYFTNYKRIIPTMGKTFSKIGLIEKRMPTGVFNSGDGGIISKSDGEIITFGANTIIDDAGNLYTGNVNVYTHHFDPENSNLTEVMPGNLLAVDKNGKLVQLVTYSMVMVELIGENGQELNLKEGTTATIEFPLKGSTATAAPNEIPLWSFDETNGLWTEEGTATKDGNYYRGEVSHFSFWNCDAPFDLINLQGRLVDEGGNPIQNIEVSLMILSNVTTASAHTNSDGIFSGKVPANEELYMRITSYCQSVIDEQIIGPFSTDQDLGDIVFEQTNFLTMTGKALECNGAPIQDGYVGIEIDGRIALTIDLDGSTNFQATIPVCSNSKIRIYVTNLNGFLQSNSYSFTYSGQSSEDVGDHTACSDLDEFVYIKFGNAVVIETEFIVRKDFIDNKYIVILTERGGHNLTLNFDKPCSLNVPGMLTASTNTTFEFDFDLSESEIGGYVEGKGIGTGNYLDISVSPPETKLAEIEVILRGKVDELWLPVSGRVWNDLNKNGLMEPNEPPMQGVQVEFRLAPNIPPTITNEDGYYNGYLSTAFPIDMYVLPPDNFTISPQNIGSNDTIDSDFDPVIGNVFDPVVGNVFNLYAEPNGSNIYDCGMYEN